MRFHALHKLTSYMMVASAFLCLVLSGEIDPITTLLGGVGIIASWYWEPPRVRPEKWIMWWNGTSLLVFLVTIIEVLSGGDIVLSFSRFLVFLLVAKLFSRVKSRDYMWCYVLAFALLTAATTLNGSLSFGVCFLVFVVSATWTLILFHLRREMEDNFLIKHADGAASEKVEVDRILNSRRIVGGKFLAATSAASLAIFLASSLLFFLFPRVGFGLFFQKRRQGITMAGFSDQVQLGGHGLIRDDKTVIMRITSRTANLNSPASRSLHWRGVAFDRYSEGQWGRSRESDRSEVLKAHTGQSLRMFLPGLMKGLGDQPAGKLQRRDLEKRLAGTFVHEVYLEPMETSVLFGASLPVMFEIEQSFIGFRRSYPYAGRNDEARFGHTAGIKYTVYSDPSMPRPEVLAKAPPSDPEVMHSYLQIPDEVPARVRELAKKIVDDAGATTPYAKALAIQEYLGTFEYTLEMKSDPTREPLDYFLFDRKKGHCEYFSSAMAIMLRAVGVPTRNVNGFLGGVWNEYGNYLAVRSGDAHSWLEVWFEGVGWITFDPTPAAALNATLGFDITEKMMQMLDSLRMKWFKWVIEYDLGQQVNVFKGIGDVFKEGSKTASGAGRDVGAFFKRHKLWFFVGAAFVAIGLFLWTWRRRDSGTSWVPGRRRDPAAKHPVAQLYRRAEGQLARKGYPRPATTTPREHARDLGARHAPGADEFQRLTGLYYAARYGEESLLSAPPSVEEARVLADAVTQALSRKQEPTVPDRRPPPVT